MMRKLSVLVLALMLFSMLVLLLIILEIATVLYFRKRATVMSPPVNGTNNIEEQSSTSEDSRDT